MIKRHLKIICLPEGLSKKFEFNIRKEHALLTVGIVVLLFFLLAGGSAYLLNDLLGAKKVAALNEKNSLLNQQLSLAKKQIETISEKMEFLIASDNELRAYAQLPELDDELLQMGVGGALPDAVADGGSQDLLSRLELIERQIGLQETSLLEVREELDRRADLLQSIPSIRPLKAGAFSSGFGRRRDPFTGRWQPHMGVDFNAPTGTPVFSAADGVVVHAKREPAYGMVIAVDHGHGYTTLYAHLSRFYVIVGERVSRGDTIGAVGNTGRSTGSHLHYEVLLNRQPQNPLDYMFEGYSFARMP